MANNITFTIGTFFSGEGMTKATTAVQHASAAAGKAATAMNALSTAFGGTDTKAGKVLNSISGLAGAMATGGPLGLAIAATTICIGKLATEFKAWRDAVEDGRKVTDALGGTYQSLIGSMTRIVETVERMKKQKLWESVKDDVEWQNAEVAAIDNLVKSYTALAGAKAAAESSAGALAVQELTNEFNDRLRAAADELERGVIAAEKDLAVSMAEAKNKVEAAAAAAQTESEKRDLLKDAVAAQKSVIENLTTAQRDTTDAEKKLKKLEDDLAVQEEKAKDAANKEQLERLKLADAEASGRDAIEEAKAAAETEKQKRLDLAEAEAAAAAELSQLDVDLAAATQKAETNDQAAAALNKIADIHDDNAKKIEKAQKDAAAGMAAEQKYHTNIDGSKYQFATDENGNILSFKDYERAQRYLGRAQRDAANAKTMAENENAEMEAWAEKMNDRVANGKSISKRDAEKLDNWNNFRKQQQDAAAEKAAAEARRKQAEQLTKQGWDEVKKIREKIDKALGVR